MTDWRETLRLGNQIADIAKTRADASGHDVLSNDWLKIAARECCDPKWLKEIK